ncbi:class I SAM-dependent methyltransferase [Nocardia higoensis]|uniref:class I SAM-dependent methyltransferase n=1 Tax=Nocardia higoensis TaxID=228599 RepID=UPI0002D5D873|nr:class I SAM-dependent methyltransferase [Nocardia higoensis]
MSAASADGARAAAIRHHYDVGNDFYRLWLDPSLTYSCAMPENRGDTLELAQERKLRYHLDAVRADRAGAVLDIGCGWGSLLRGLAARGVARGVGLTLSDEQAAHVRGLGLPGVSVQVCDWLHYETDRRFDGIVSIGAFEHFATPDQSSVDKIAVYREFFGRCRDWLHEDGTLSVQTIAYANMSPQHADSFIQREVFPNADLPTLAEITAAAEGLFEIRTVRNDRLDYAWTCEQWARRLRARRDEAVELVGPEITERYERYLKLSALGFRMGKICLLRIVLDPYRDGYFVGRRDL